jgi:hypothetical protein
MNGSRNQFLTGTGGELRYGEIQPNGSGPGEIDAISMLTLDRGEAAVPN